MSGPETPNQISVQTTQSTEGVEDDGTDFLEKQLNGNANIEAAATSANTSEITDSVSEAKDSTDKFLKAIKLEAVPAELQPGDPVILPGDELGVYGDDWQFKAMDGDYLVLSRSGDAGQEEKMVHKQEVMIDPDNFPAVNHENIKAATWDQLRPRLSDRTVAIVKHLLDSAAINSQRFYQNPSETLRAYLDTM